MGTADPENDPAVAPGFTPSLGSDALAGGDPIAMESGNLGEGSNAGGANQGGGAGGGQGTRGNGGAGPIGDSSVDALPEDGLPTPDGAGGALGGGTLTAGDLCETGSDCSTGHCIDGVCCSKACAELCSSCNVPGMEGSCVTVEYDEACGELGCAAGTECRQFVLGESGNCADVGLCLVEASCEEVLADPGTPCQNGEGACSADGQCVIPEKLLLGETCTEGADCGSGHCVTAVDGAMRCCELACDGLCEACSEEGLCDAVPADDARCSNVGCPGDTSCVSYPADLVDERCAAIGRCHTAATHCQPNYEEDGATCGSGLACDGQGTCASLCSTSQAWCGGSCVNPNTSNAHCGQCNRACGAGTVCSNGGCVPDCDPGEVTCSGACVDPATDEAYCGASGNCLAGNAGDVCTSPFSCVGGTCVCPSGQIDCGGACINPATDEGHCGASGTCSGGSQGTACQNGHACESGVCRLQCSSGQVGCGGVCINPATDENHCGATDYCEGSDDGEQCTGVEQCTSGTCRVPNGEPCNVGTDCVTGTCTTFYADVDGDGFGAASSGTLRICGQNSPGWEWVPDDSDCCDIADVLSYANEANPDYTGGPRTYGVEGCAEPFDWDCDGFATEVYDDRSCSEYTTQATCPYGHFYTGAVPNCGVEGDMSLCGWTGTVCMGVRGAVVPQACY